jgi:hypothetical protein
VSVTVLGDHIQYTKIHLEVQGGLVAVKREVKAVEKLQHGSTRGPITAFSLASRKRLMRKTARIAASRAVFMTLTYPARFPTARVSKNHLRALLERIRRRYPQASAVWRLEFQKRGAPHFHLLFYNLPYLPFWTLKAWWSDIIREYVDLNRPRVHLKLLTNNQAVLRYVSKYVAKAERTGSDPCLFINGSYLHAPSKTARQSFQHIPVTERLCLDLPELSELSPGRFWGVFAGHLLPFAPQVWVTLEQVTGSALPHILARLAQEWEGIDPTWEHGVCVFSNYAYLAWLDCLVLARQDMPVAHTEITVKEKKHGARSSETTVVNPTQDQRSYRLRVHDRERVGYYTRTVGHAGNDRFAG